jgi:hypothetical protein
LFGEILEERFGLTASGLGGRIGLQFSGRRVLGLGVHGLASFQFVILPAGAAFFATAGEFVHGGPGPCFRSFHAGTTLLVAGFDVDCLPFLFVGATGFIALGHGGYLRLAIFHPFIDSR